jgi:lipopolysaccharide/colanic/teichoic acid biosynthesis glycosyltransferase
MHPPSLIPECDPSLSDRAETGEALRSLVGPGLEQLWRPARGGPPSIAGAGWRLYDRSKRLLDIIIAAPAIIVLSPIFAVVASLVWWTSPGPVIFRQKRLGLRGRIFWCYKFRTMVNGAEEQLRRSAKLAEQYQGNFKIKDDPRLTSIGGFLRKASLDELPQFFNVLRGDISLIGPRPIVEPEQVKYGVYAEKLLSVKPGLSGRWQVSGRAETTYDERIAMDMNYIDNRSLWLDLKLILLTVYVVLRGRETY